MKNFKLFFLLTLAVAFSSCGNDDDGPSVIELTNENFAGTYEITFLETEYVVTGVASNGSEVIIETEIEKGDTFTDAIFVFNTNGTYTTSGGYRATYTLTVNGDSETDSEIVTLNDAGTYSLNASNKTITIDGEPANIVSFDGTKMVLTAEIVETFNEETTTINTEIRLVKRN